MNSDQQSQRFLFGRRHVQKGRDIPGLSLFVITDNFWPFGDDECIDGGYF